ncbi:MAG: hypothetical protein WC947_05890 [Elusimicrobiota bacterium]
MKFIYRIKVKSNEIISVLAKDGTNHFVSPVTKKSNKIYLLGKNGLIHYIGITKQPIISRLRYKPNHKSGYHGYKWLKENGDHCLVIWMFNNDVSVEAVEAEIVYFFRKQYHQWPKYQTEIHFHSTTKNERTLAKTVLKESQNIVRNFT